MILRAAAVLALAGAASPVLAAEGGAIRGGEHDGFSRIVMTIEPTTEWSLENGEGAVTIRFPGRTLAFDAAGVFARMPTARISAVSVAREAGGTAVRVTLGCDCRVTHRLRRRTYLALDVADPGAAPPPPPETAGQRDARETAVVASAEEVLLRQIERAAGQGIVVMSGPSAAPAPAEASAQVALRHAGEPGPAKTPELEPEPRRRPVPAVDMAALFHDQKQIEATSVFDRDSARARAGAEPAVADACLPDEALDVASWTNGRPFSAQLAPLRRDLVGEFDAPEPERVIDLTRLYVRFGFGVEARSVLAGFDGDGLPDDGALLADLGRIVDGEPASADGPLAYAGACPGRGALWLALGGRAPAFIDADQFEAVHGAFEELPVDMRRLLGPALVGRLLDARRPAEARVILDTVVRAGAPAEPDPAVAIAVGRVLAAEGRTAEAIGALVATADAGGPMATEAMVVMVEAARAAGIPVPDRTIVDLRAAALLNRGTSAEPRLRALLAEALAARAELPAAIEETRAAMADMPAAAGTFGSIAVASLGDADPATVGSAAYAETVLGAEDLLVGAPPRDPARRRVATHLIALGLPAPALAILAPALVLDDPAARLIAAEAEIGLGDAAAARAALAGLEGSPAAVLTARSYMIEGRYGDAVAALKAAGLDTEAAAYAWPSGDWASVDGADPERAAMAGYMAGQPGAGQPGAGQPGAAPASAAEPATPEAAFQAPVPSLDRPTLRAARELLSSGPGVSGFIGGVIAQGDAAGAGAQPPH